MGDFLRVYLGGEWAGTAMTHSWVGVLLGVLFCVAFAAIGLIHVLYPKQVSDWYKARPHQLVDYSPLYVRLFGIVFTAFALLLAALIVAFSV